MSRAGYTDDNEDGILWLYRQAVKRAITGKRGREFLIALRDAMDAMPEKVLDYDQLASSDGAFCALGVALHTRGIDTQTIDTEDYDELGKTLNISPSMAREIMYENDEGGSYSETPEQRWTRMRKQIDIWLEGRVN